MATKMKKNKSITISVRATPEPEIGEKLAQLYEILLSAAQPDKTERTEEIENDDFSLSIFKETQRVG